MSVDETEAVARAILGFARERPRIFPADIAKPGEQVLLFIGPCLYCGAGYVPHLPHPCPSCGADLKGLVAFPIWVRGPRTARLWWRWMVFRRRLRDVIPVSLRALITVTDAMARASADRRFR